MRRRLSSSSTTKMVLCFILPFAMNRQQDRKGSALVRVGLSAEDAAVLFYNPMRHGEPLAGPGLRGCQEGIEDAVAIRGADAATLVPHLDEDALVPRPGGEQHVAALGHRLDGVDEQVAVSYTHLTLPTIYSV